tara:strand:- start:13171 stop:13542 length:372 start_codon:yes stop_codon:yes gene_type:complete
MTGENNFLSIKIIPIFLTFIGLIFLILPQSMFLSVTQNDLITLSKERAVFILSCAFFLWQIHNFSTYFYYQLLDVFSLIFFLFLVFDPLFSVMIYSWCIWLYSIIIFLMILLLQYDKYTFKDE